MAALGVDVKGKIAADEQMADGRAVARLSDIGWGTRLRELVGPGAADDGPVTPAVVDAVVAVLKTLGLGASARSPSWRCRRAPGRSSSPRWPSGSPSSASSSCSARSPTPTADPPAAAAATAPTGSPRCGSASSSRRTSRRRWRRSTGPVLLVDDVADSRWTLTVAARELRRAGATAVLPLALAIDA